MADLEIKKQVLRRLNELRQQAGDSPAVVCAETFDGICATLCAGNGAEISKTKLKDALGSLHQAGWIKYTRSGAHRLYFEPRGYEIRLCEMPAWATA